MTGGHRSVSSVLRHPRWLCPYLTAMALHNGEKLPSIIGRRDGSPADVVDIAAGSWAAVLLYRGHW